jgi:hypothetical protein
MPFPQPRQNELISSSSSEVSVQERRPRRQQIEWMHGEISGNPKQNDHDAERTDPACAQEWLRQPSPAQFEKR